MKILVTGATGFIGKHLVKKMLNNNIDVVIIQRADTRKKIKENVKNYTLSFENPNEDIEFLNDQHIDGVIHLASVYLPAHNTMDIKNLINSNIFFGTYLLECAIKSGIKWFINTGTFWQHYENKEYSPVNLYAATKEAFMDIAKYYIQTEKTTFVTLKLSDTYGPGDTRHKILNLFQKNAASGEILDMSPGEQVIDILHIDDVIDAYVKLIDLLENRKVNSGDVYAIRAANRLTLKELADCYTKATNEVLNINWGGRPYRTREVMIPWENGKILPNWIPKKNIIDGIREVFYKEV